MDCNTKKITDWIIENNASSKQARKHFNCLTTGDLNTKMASIRGEECYNRALKIMKQNSYKDLKAYETFLFLQENKTDDIRKLYYNFGIKSKSHFNTLISKIDKKEIYEELLLMVNNLRIQTEEHIEKLNKTKSAEFKWRNKDKKIIK